MSDAAAAEAFLGRFVLPLVEGGELHVGPPLGPAGVKQLGAAIAQGLDGTPLGERLHAARQLRLAALGRPTAPRRLAEDQGSAPLLGALHDLLFLAHPDAARLKPARLTALARATQSLAKAARLRLTDPGPEADALLLSRHSLLGGLWSLRRLDIQRNSASGPQLFRGVAPPRRWLSLGSEPPDEHIETRIVPELLGLCDGLGRSVVQALLQASPLTDLWDPLRAGLGLASALPFGWLEHARWLRLPATARLLVRRYLELELPAVAGALCPSLLSILEQTTPGSPPGRQRALCTWLSLVSHLHLTAHVLTRCPLPQPSAQPAVLDLYGLYAALFEQRPDLAMPPDVVSDPQLRPQVELHVQLCRERVGPTRTRALGELCVRALGSAPA